LLHNSLIFNKTTPEKPSNLLPTLWAWNQSGLSVFRGWDFEAAERESVT